MENKRVKLNNGEWSNDVKNKEYQKVIELNENLKDFMKEVLEVELRYKEFCELMDYPDDPNNYRDWWGEVRQERRYEIDGLFYPTEEAVRKAYEVSKAEMIMFKQMKQNTIDYGCPNPKWEED
tara:strand:+ start:378 stop:746 length:369 start_codon:yes stop_codon:yes gene_type:complete